MSVDPTHDLIADLTGDLEPVEPVAALRWSSLAILAAWAAFIGALLLYMGPRRELWFALSSNPSFAATFGGLILAAVGGTVAGLASRIPGRERAAHGGLALAFGGLATAAGLCIAVYFASEVDPDAPIAAGMCLQNAAMYAVVPAMVLVLLVIRGWVARPWIAATSGLIGTGAVSALAIHMHCGSEDALHMLVGHVAAPVLIMAIGAPIAAWVLRAAGRR